MPISALTRSVARNGTPWRRRHHDWAFDHSPAEPASPGAGAPSCRSRLAASPWEEECGLQRHIDVRRLVVALALMAAGCGSGSLVAACSLPGAVARPAETMTARLVLPWRTIAAGSSMSGA